MREKQSVQAIRRGVRVSKMINGNTHFPKGEEIHFPLKN